MSTDTIQKLARPSVLGGAMIIAGTAVGAGMFSIPIVTSGVWFSGSVALLVYTWACMLLSGLMILEATLHYPSGASFNTMVRDLLGKGWNAVNGLSVAFVLYILTYAYISAGGSIIAHTLEGIVGVGQTTAGLVFALVVAFIVWLSTRAVDRLSTILIGGMVITFVMSVGDMFTHVQPAVLFNTGDDQASYLPYALAALPYLLTSFGYHGNIPGLVKYYHKDSGSVVRSLVYGTLLALAIYILWQYVIQGNIARDAFKQVIAEGRQYRQPAQANGQRLQQPDRQPTAERLLLYGAGQLVPRRVAGPVRLPGGLLQVQGRRRRTQQDRAGDLCAADPGRAAVPERFPVRHRLRRAGGHHLGSDRAGTDGARQPPPLSAGGIPRTGRQRRDPVRHPVRADQRHRAYSVAVRSAAGLPLIPEGRASALPFPHCFYTELLPEISGASTLSQLL